MYHLSKRYNRKGEKNFSVGYEFIWILGVIRHRLEA